MNNLPGYLKELRTRLAWIGRNPRRPKAAPKATPKRKPIEGACQLPRAIVAPPRRRYGLRESMRSCRRLRYLTIPLVLLLLAISGAVWHFNSNYEMKRYSDLNQVSPIQSPTESGNNGGGGSAQRFTTAIINGRAFRIETADTDEERRLGLQHRTSLDPSAAMLFVYTQEQVLGFWMKNVNFPLDIIFLDREKRIIDIQSMEPQPGVPEAALRIYRSKAPAQYALEIYGGLAVQYGFSVGALVDLK